MHLSKITAVYLLVAISFIIAVAAEIFIDDYVQPHSLFAYLLVGTIITSTIPLLLQVVN